MSHIGVGLDIACESRGEMLCIVLFAEVLIQKQFWQNDNVRALTHGFVQGSASHNQRDTNTSKVYLFRSVADKNFGFLSIRSDVLGAGELNSANMDNSLQHSKCGGGSNRDVAPAQGMVLIL